MPVEFKEVSYASKENILFLANAPRADFAVTFVKDDSLATTDADGRKIVKAGTPYPANDATAVGLVSEDYDVTDGDVSGSVIILGFVDKNKMPVVPTSEAITALKGIYFMPFNYAVLFSVALSSYTLAPVDATPADITASITGFEVSGETPTYIAESDDEAVATVSVSGSTITVTATGSGTANITVSTTINGVTKSAICVVTSTYTP